MSNIQYIANELLYFLTLSDNFENSVRDFRIMTGAKQIIVDEKNHSIKCILPLTVTGRKWNVLDITLNGLDLVDVKCSKNTVRGYKLVHEWENLYGEDVYRIFREATGVETRIPRFC
jgi:hypothetical protein